MERETQDFMVIRFEDLKITLPFETRLASVCLSCPRVLYHTDKINSITSRVFD